MKNKAFIVGLVLSLLTGCSSGITPYAKSIGIKEAEEIDGLIQNLKFGIAMFIKQGVLTPCEGNAEQLLEIYHLTVENRSESFRSGYLGAVYRDYPEAQHRPRLCRAVDFDPEGIPRDLACKGVKLSTFGGDGGSSMESQPSSREPVMPQQRTVPESHTGALPPKMPFPPSSSQYTVFSPDGTMQICNMSTTTQTVFCY